jgi:hypothetical protein
LDDDDDYGEFDEDDDYYEDEDFAEEEEAQTSAKGSNSKSLTLDELNEGHLDKPRLFLLLSRRQCSERGW